MQWNIRSYSSHLPYLHTALDTLQPDVLCLQETFLPAHRPVRITSFQQPPARKDREDRTGGGVLILVRISLPYIILDLPSPLEVVAVKLFLPSGTVTICSLYLPPDYDNSILLAHLNSLLPLLPPPFIICVDANAHHPSWGSLRADRRGRLVDGWVTDHQLHLLNTGDPTYLSSSGSYSHIDLTICSAALSTTFSWEPSSDPFNSDHFPITITSSLSTPPLPTPQRWQLHLADWTGFRSTLALPSHFLSPTQACGAVTDAILAAALPHVPLSRPIQHHGRSKCWWNPECAEARRQKNRALSRYRRHLGCIDMWIAFKRARAVFRSAVKQARQSSWSSFVADMTSQVSSAEVWRRVRMLSGGAPPRAVVLRVDGALIADPLEVATAFARSISFKSVGVTTDPQFSAVKLHQESLPFFFPPDNGQWYNLPFRLCELHRALRSSTSKSPGPDRIPFAFLHHFSTSDLSSLLAFFNFLWEHGFPHQWREATVIPLLKHGKPAHDCSSYRPIALTNCLCKLLEKMVNWRLQGFLEKKLFYDPCQSGFRAGHSTLDALTRLETSVSESLLTGSFCLAVFLDISRAFDSVWHRGLLLKLRTLGLCGSLACFIEQFLKLRRFTVRIQGVHSDPHPLYSGVPQGSVISPSLFTILINDLFANLPAGVSHSLYADDGALWVSCPSLAEAVDRMQTALALVDAWSHRWGLSISASKTQAMLFTRRRRLPTPSLLLNDTPLIFVRSAKFLGLTLDCRMSWGPHIASLRMRCQRDLRLLSLVAARRWGADFITLKRLYVALIRSKLDYASFLFDSAAPSLLIHLDRIQYAALRIVLGVLRCTPTYLLEAEADIMPLSLRRRFLMSHYFYRILGITNHPLARLALSYRPLHHLFDRPLPLSVTGRMHVESELLFLPLTEAPPLSLSHRYLFPKLPVFSHLAVAAKSSFSAAQWSLLFQELLAQYPTHTAVYCDGSVRGEAVGCGVWSSSFQLLCRLPAGASILTAELYAIYSAVIYVSSLPGSFVLFTDSLSSVSALQFSCAPRNYLVARISDALLALPDGKVSLEWVPSHMGISGNEKADSLASHSLTLSSPTSVPLPLADLTRYLKRHYFAAWQAAWSRRSPALTLHKPLLGSSVETDLPRPHQVCITRLRLRTCSFTHQHYFTGTPPTSCQSCSCVMSLRHLLLDCPSLATARVPLFAACRKLQLPEHMDSLLSTDFPAPVLLAYLQATSYIDKI